MGINRIAKGIVLVPCLLLGVAFFSAALWGDGPAAANRPLALALGGLLVLVALLSQFLPEPSRPVEGEAGGPPGSAASDQGRQD